MSENTENFFENARVSSFNKGSVYWSRRCKWIYEYGHIGEKSNNVTQTGADASKLALPPNTNPAIYQEFEVIKEILGTVQAEIAPWGGSAGGGLQYELPMPIL